jgi:hypothetical protein
MLRLASITVLTSTLLVACGNTAELPAHPAGAATSSAPTASAAAPASVVDLVSGERLGPVRVGMDLAALQALGLPVKQGPGSAVAVGPYEVYLKDGQVSSIRVELADVPGVRIGGKIFTADAGTTIEGIAATLSGCSPVYPNLGGNVILCDGAKTALFGWGRLEVNVPQHAAEMVESYRRSYGPAPR